MKYIGLCGLHGAGKTHLANRLCTMASWHILDKRSVLKKLYESGWSRRSQDEAWEAWYRSVYERFGSGALMAKALEQAEDLGSVLIIDAVHTPEEWHALKANAPSSILVGIWAPQTVRDIRRDEPQEMDARRTLFWHHDGSCLMSMVEWAFPGSLSSELLDRLCEEFIIHATSSS